MVWVLMIWFTNYQSPPVKVGVYVDAKSCNEAGKVFYNQLSWLGDHRGNWSCFQAAGP